ncbi:C2 calcium/lipid-binding plantphosphoribosyltransferase family protein [Striga asiatica]|uniref:C2 calcium/lipid-binding plantphosphoribosyltransferase family protein n=1 Tax=Striga asiatica TaxID=4170 RepID=A0A5A7P2J3_STRAF|nr:C2 calcium/lipid-binding plantphosphoribosyltransferase family protein [Striga asiatica]
MGNVRKLIVEVVDARNLVPKDGHGASSPYVILDFHGQRRKTKTVVRDLNPTWNETLEFNADKTSDVFGDMLELDVLHDVKVGPTTRNNFLGRVRLNSGQFVRKGEEALIYYPLEKKNLLSWIQGEIGLKIYFQDEIEIVPPPPEAKVDPAPENAEPPPATNAPDAEAKNSEIPAAEPKPDCEKPAEDPPAENPPENASSRAVKVETPPPDKNYDQLKPHVSPGLVPEVKVNSLNTPQPISRISSVSSFASDLSDRSTMERSTFDLVDKMHYIFVRVVKARSLPTTGSPVVKIVVSGRHVVSRPARLAAASFEWEQTFAFARGDSSDVLEVSVWDPAAGGGGFLGGICFDAGEIPLRDPPDSSLAPQWYRLEGGGAHRGDLMLAAWVGTQADESFPDAWKADAANSPTSRSKVYQSPKLWYLRSCVVEAQDLPTPMPMPLKQSSYQIKAQLGFQVQRTKPAVSSTGGPTWNEDLMFVAAEPFTEHSLTFFLLENRPTPKEPLVVGVARVPLMSIERRVDDRTVAPRWCTMEDPNSEEKPTYRGRVQLRLCFDGGYHVMDEGAHVCSDYRPTARQLWKPPVGTIELGIIGCRNLVPTKTTSGGKGSADAYAVAKYGSKWVRTRTISDNLDPKWNEQYTWRVYDPSTVLTLAVFDSWQHPDELTEPTRPDSRLGKVRIRISTLTTGHAYRSTFPLLLLSRAGLKKMGEIELAVRFTRAGPTLDLLHVYSQPLLPAMHHLRPLVQQETLRSAAVRIVSAHLSRSEPPLCPEVVAHMLDSDSSTFSMRKVRANWFRIINMMTGVIELFKWVDETRSWRNPTATVLVHALLVMLVWFPDLIVPSLAFYVFAVGAWNYRFRPKSALPHFDPKLSLAECVEREELDEEFDCVGPSEVRVRYNKLRVMGARAQVLLGVVAAQGERVQALVAWRDPRATGIFVGLCLVVAFVLYLVPPKMVAVAVGFYYLRHPIFRDRMPSPAVNFFQRLPSLADRML